MATYNRFQEVPNGYWFTTPSVGRCDTQRIYHDNVGGHHRPRCGYPFTLRRTRVRRRAPSQKNQQGLPLTPCADHYQDDRRVFLFPSLNQAEKRICSQGFLGGREGGREKVCVQQNATRPLGAYSFYCRRAAGNRTRSLRTRSARTTGILRPVEYQHI